MILDLLTYIVLRFFGHIILALVLLICTLIVKNNLSQLIVLLKSQGNPKPNPLDLPVLSLEPEKNEELTDEEFLKTFGQPPLSEEPLEEPLEVKAPSKPLKKAESSSSTQTRKEESLSLSQLLMEAARGDGKE